MNTVETEEHKDIPNNVLEVRWPQQDFQELVKRIELAIPKKDGLAYSTRVEKLNWDEISFNSYSGEKCKSAWLFIQKRIRTFRYLREILQDAKEFLSMSWPNFIQNESLTEQSELPCNSADGTLSKPTDIGPKKPQTPFELYYKAQFKTFKPEDLSSFREQWKNLSDAKKLIWIDLALESESNYQEELKKYILQNPNFTPEPSEPVLSKEEELLKDTLAGKPNEPPHSAYGLFFQMMMQSEDIKKIDFKHRIESISEQWKTCTDDEKKRFKERADYLTEKYKIEFPNYIETLPEAKINRDEVKRKETSHDCANQLKKKLKPATTTSIEENNVSTDIENKEKTLHKVSNVSKHHGGNSDQEAVQKETDSDFLKILQTEPPKPPVSGRDLFFSCYRGRVPTDIAWRKLRTQDKEKYQAQVERIKQAYINDYEIFLRRLTTEQLTAYSQLKKKACIEQVSGDSSSDGDH